MVNRWGSVCHTELGKQAVKYIEGNTKARGLAYHNIQHVNSMYQYLELNKVAYDLHVDWAVLFHDLIYDDKKEKEYRSALAFSGLFELFKDSHLQCRSEDKLMDVDIEVVYDLIMCTSNHVVKHNPTGSEILILADLHGLKDTKTTLENFVAIMNESISLYKINENDFAKANEIFMKDLYTRVESNISYASNPEEFKEILNGISNTIQLARLMRGL